MAKEWNEQEVEESLQKYREYTDRNKEDLDRIKGYTDELSHRMQAAEDERQKDLPDHLDHEQLQVELEWTRKRMDYILARLYAMEQQAAAAAAQQRDNVYEHVEHNGQNGDTVTEAIVTKTQQLSVAEPMPDYDHTPKTKDVVVTEVLEPLSKEETDNAVDLIEVMKHDGKLDSESNKALLTEIVSNLEASSTGVPLRRNAKERKLQENLLLLQEDLATNRDHTRLTDADLSMLQYQLKSGKYKTRTLKQIRQGNTKHRVSLFDAL